MKSKLKKSPTHHNLKHWLIWLFVLSILSKVALAEIPKCDEEMIATTAKHFQLPHQSLKQKIISQDCKKWPNDNTKTLVLFAYDEDSPQKKLLLALIDYHFNIVSSYSQLLPEEDAITRVDTNSLRLDLAPYWLSKTTRGFGVVFDMRYYPCPVEGGSSQQLQLFVAEGKLIRPLFKNPTPILYWHRGTTDCFNPHKTFSTPITIQILKSASHGFANLKFVAKESEEIDIPPYQKLKRRFSFTVKYDGEFFDLTPWESQFSSWYEKGHASSP